MSKQKEMPAERCWFCNFTPCGCGGDGVRPQIKKAMAHKFDSELVCARVDCETTWNDQRTNPEACQGRDKWAQVNRLRELGKRDLAELVSMRIDGMSYKAIGERWGVADAVVSSFFREIEL